MDASVSTGGRELVDHCPACGGSERTETFAAPPQMSPPGPSFPFASCASCGAVWLAERVPAHQVALWYGKDYLPHRGEEAWGPFAPLVRMGQRGTDRARIRAVERMTALTPDTRVLDVGCGRPTFLRALREAYGCRCSGVDLRLEAWRSAPGYEDIDLAEGLLPDVKLGGPFDVLTMWHYLEHDYQPLETLRALREESAHPDTVLLVEVPRADAPSRRWGGTHWGGLHTPRHTVLYTPTALATLLRRAGWEVLPGDLPGTLDPWILWWLSWRERRGTDWAGSMAGYFPGFLFGRTLLGPVLRRMGPDILLVAARPS